MSSHQRPNFISLHTESQDSVSRPLRSPLRSPPLRSPRLPAAGDVPPELSPLDAFALQSRLLARQLEESAKSGHRVSRLPPLTTSSPLVMQGRSEYYRSLSYDNGLDGDRDLSDNSQQPVSAISQPATPSGFGVRTPEVEEPSVRPQSMHPRMSRIPPTPDDGVPPPVPEYARERYALLQRSQMKPEAVDEDDGTSYFGARRERSPSPLAEEPHDQQSPRTNRPYSFEEDKTAEDWQTKVKADEASQPAPPSTSPPKEAFQPTAVPAQQPSSMYSSTSSFTQSPEKTLLSKNSFDSTSGGLAPPRTLFPKRSSSIMSSPLEINEEDNRSTMCSSVYSLNAPRKLSASSLASPGPGGYFQRSPSISSDMSAPLPRPSFNFSRPMSRVGTPGIESPARQASSDSQTSYSQSSFVLADDAANTPISMNSEGFPDSAGLSDDSRAAPPSHIYSKFALPRGKMPERPNLHDANNQHDASCSWEQPMGPPNNSQTLPFGGQAPPSPPTRPSSSGNLMPRPSLERSKLSTEMVPPASELSPNPSRASTDGGRSSDDAPRGRTMIPSHEAHVRGRTPASTATSDTASTVKARTVNTLATATEISAEEHVDKAISLHESGLLNESTYHLRHAARQGNPTGMLLYALACRHGWGMRANPKEGAEWLRKAADCASVEIADDEAMIKEGKMVDSVDRKTRKAQFALSIYELGVSYLNGWGIEQDRPLALRCFEIAGSWGDVDALAEAGFCYAQGIGCKKNLKQSARFYLQAEAKGMSMVGNSWIHKAKYNDDNESVKSEKDKDKKTRSKSRTRTMFGIKHHQ